MKSVLEKAEAEEKALSGGEADEDVQDFKIDGDSVKVDGMAETITEEAAESKPAKVVAAPKATVAPLALA